MFQRYEAMFSLTQQNAWTEFGRGEEVIFICSSPVMILAMCDMSKVPVASNTGGFQGSVKYTGPEPDCTMNPMLTCIRH